MARAQPLPQLAAVAPNLDCTIIPIAEDQPEYLTIYAALLRNPGYACPNGRWNTITLAFRPDAEQVRALQEGRELYVSLLTFGQPMPPIIVQVGKESVSAAFNVPIATDG